MTTQSHINSYILYILHLSHQLDYMLAVKWQSPKVSDVIYLTVREVTVTVQEVE